MVDHITVSLSVSPTFIVCPGSGSGDFYRSEAGVQTLANRDLVRTGAEAQSVCNR